MYRLKIAGVIGAAAALAAGPSLATITTFAAFTTPTGTVSDFFFANSGSSATFNSTTSTTSSAEAGVPVTFSFVNVNTSLDSAVTNVAAIMNFTSSEASTAAQNSFGYAIQPGLMGGFTITTAQAITVAGVRYAPGAVLLSATFAGAGIAGPNNSSNGNFDANNENSGYTLSYSSPFLTFQTGSTLDASLALTSVTPPLGDVQYGTDALNSFTGFATGSFSADPVPRGVGTPEPASWALMLLGIGAMGSRLRRSRELRPAVG